MTFSCACARRHFISKPTGRNVVAIWKDTVPWSLLRYNHGDFYINAMHMFAVCEVTTRPHSVHTYTISWLVHAVFNFFYVSLIIAARFVKKRVDIKKDFQFKLFSFFDSRKWNSLDHQINEKRTNISAPRNNQRLFRWTYQTQNG